MIFTKMILTKWDPKKSSKSLTARMEKARNVALTGNERQRHGAILMQGSRVLAVGVNTFRNNPALVTHNDYTMASYHAEYMATRIHALVPNTTLYVVRVNKAHDFALSLPCRSCQKYLVWETQIKEVIYS